MSKEKLEKSVDLLHSFWAMQRNLMCFIQEKSAAESLSVPQFTILIMMRTQTSINQKRLQEETNMPKSTLSQAVEGLVQRKLLIREQMENDRRGMLLSITNEGQQLLNHIHTDKCGIHDRFYEAVKHLSIESIEDTTKIHEEITYYFNEKGRGPSC